MTLSENRFEIYAVLEKGPPFEMRDISSKIAVSQCRGFFPKALKYGNRLKNIF